MNNKSDTDFTSILIKIADRLDQENKEELASEVDKVIQVVAARKKAPLKHLDDKTKKDLIKFVKKVEKNLKESADSMDELFRRLRYFDVHSIIDEIGLGKTTDEIKGIHSGISDACKKIYELSYGKKPSKEQMDDDDQIDFGHESFFKSREMDKEQGKEMPKDKELGSDIEKEVTKEEEEKFWENE